MLVAAISFLTSLCFMMMVSCIVFFIIVKRKQRAALKRNLDKKKDTLAKKIEELEKSIDKVENAPRPSPDTIEQKIPDAPTGKTGEIGTFSFGKDYGGNTSSFGDIRWKKMGAGTFTYANNKYTTKAFYLKHPDHGKCLKMARIPPDWTKYILGDRCCFNHAFRFRPDKYAECPTVNSNSVTFSLDDMPAVFEERSNGLYFLNDKTSDKEYGPLRYLYTNYMDYSAFGSR